MKKMILDYYSELDSGLELLSNQFEKHITGLPSWVLCPREINVITVPSKAFFIIRVIPNTGIGSDILNEIICSSNAEIDKAMSPFSTGWRMDSTPQNYGVAFADLVVKKGEEGFNSVPVQEFPGQVIMLSPDQFDIFFELDKAKKEAQDLWNNAINQLPFNGSFISNLKNIFLKFELIIRRKSFLERRVHRYIKEYSKFLLPLHKKCFFEHELFLKGEKRVADFILEREMGFPALLIELENPSNKMFKKNGELTAEANHAKNQISEWVKFIEQNSSNTDTEMSFLSGPKQRLVIMGRGLEFLEKMIDSKHTDTVIWTYDLLIRETKQQWNATIKEQCTLLGISNPNLLNIQ